MDKTAYLEVVEGFRDSGLTAFTFRAKLQEYYEKEYFYSDGKKTVTRGITGQDFNMGFAYRDEKIFRAEEKSYILVDLVDDERNDDSVQWVSFPSWQMNILVDKKYLRETI